MKPFVALTATVLAALLAAPAFANEAAPAPAKADIAKGEQTAAVCGACHTVDGSRGLTANPILQGQHPDYIVKQLTEFKAGKRKNAVMNGMAAPLTEADMKNVAAFYGSKKPVPGAAKNKDTLALGEKIWRGGIADKQVPACAGCHGPAGAGIPAQYPRLGGQHTEYLEAQMNAFRSGERANSAQMMAIAAKMSDKEIKAVTDYATGLR
ncbi:cytochrome c4 [Ideonella sp. 4Y11]|uniref:Cytochrome c4 n=1 Tax=Ideonella aquatica TaxID=2824119 RepID=A0A940YEV2_9BURK|nr:c-type cytochrome [Ideonella aquatica]MBQ0958014.1 cytochrome c4 [Ideonella aquatica]